MKAYRVKHIPTGLYYQPRNGHNNLSPKGKVYNTNNSIFSGQKSIRISIKSHSKIYKEFKDVLLPYKESQNKGGEEYNTTITYVMPIEQFEKEYLTINV